MAREVPLTRGLVALIDDEDYDRVACHLWHASGSGRVTYAQTAVAMGSNRQKSVSLHRFITGWPLVDHINHNGLDNRRVNLRRASVSENNRNSRTRSDSETGFKGVRLVREYVQPRRVRDTSADSKQRGLRPARVRGDRLIWNDDGGTTFVPGGRVRTAREWVASDPPAVVPGQWSAHFRDRRIGIFYTPEAAARAYDAVAREAYGAFACLNFPDDAPSSVEGLLMAQRVTDWT